MGELGACELFCRVCSSCDIASFRHWRILEQACAVLGNVSKKNKTNRAAIGQCGGAKTLAHVLGRTLAVGTEADSIAMQCLRAVGNVLMRNEVQ